VAGNWNRPPTNFGLKVALFNDLVFYFKLKVFLTLIESNVHCVVQNSITTQSLKKMHANVILISP